MLWVFLGSLGLASVEEAEMFRYTNRHIETLDTTWESSKNVLADGLMSLSTLSDHRWHGVALEQRPRRLDKHLASSPG